MSSNRIVIWGAGKIGRGFAADLFQTGGFELTFVDADKGLVDGLNDAGHYTVLKLPSASKREEVRIGPYRAIHTGEQGAVLAAVREVDLIALAVFPTAFAETAGILAKAIEARADAGIGRPQNILICANVFHTARELRRLILERLPQRCHGFFESNVGLVETLVIRMAVAPTSEMVARDPYVVLTNGYPELIYDGVAYQGKRPAVAGLVPTENIAAEECRKVFTYNMVHAVYAYLGKARGLTYVYESSQDPVVGPLAESALREASDALICEFGFTKGDMDLWNQRVLENMANPILKDTIDRVGADPVRKLGRQDRLVGPALLCRKHGLLPYYLCKAIAYGLRFDNRADDGAQRIAGYLKGHTADDAIRQFCGIDVERELTYLIRRHYEKAAQPDGLAEDGVKVATLKKAYGLGYSSEKKYRGCAQCTLKAVFALTGRSNRSLFQAASGFSGGIAITGDGSCGGYTGGVLAMGTYAGRRLEMLELGDKDAQYKSYDMAQRLHDRYLEAYGSVTCADIHRAIFGRAFNLRTKPVREEFEAAGAHADKCTSVIALASMWVAELLMEEGFYPRGKHS